METKKYIFSLDYGNRMEEKEFIKAVLREFDSNTLVGCGIFVNNNPYCLELLFFASLEKDTDRFEDFMKKHFNDKQRVFNYFFDDIIHFLRREMLDFTAFPVFFVSNLLLVQRKKYYFNRATVSRNCSIVL